MDIYYKPGVTVWEILSFGEKPYEFEHIPPKDLLRQLQRGVRLRQPDHVTLELYTLILRTWTRDVRVFIIK